MDPIVTSFEPKTGPSIGGTQMIINGIGFTPRKDANGNADLKKNHMWIRFVDPDTFEVLAPQIKTTVKTGIMLPKLNKHTHSLITSHLISLSCHLHSVQ